MGNCVGKSGGQSKSCKGPDGSGGSSEGVLASLAELERLKNLPRLNAFEKLKSFNIPRCTLSLKYQIGKTLGSGHFGVISLAKCRLTGKSYACKTISSSCLQREEDLRDAIQEILVMKHICGHPNIVTLKECLQDKRGLHIIMELCTGGDLFSRIQAIHHYSEKEAAKLFCQCVQSIRHCHQLGVAHRDIKLDNFLLLTSELDSKIKLADFGLSSFYQPGKVLDDSVGTLYYMSPEAIEGQSDLKSDIWSLGITLYILLTGVPPFIEKDETSTLYTIMTYEEKVLRQRMKRSYWKSISDDAKDLVRRMLRQDPRKRPSINEVYDHPWLQKISDRHDKDLGYGILERLKAFVDSSRMRQLTLLVMTRMLSEDEIEGLRQMFRSFDKDHSGTITLGELENGLYEFGNDSSKEELSKIMKAADIDKDGYIDYEEFVASCMNSLFSRKEENVRKAFAAFDTDCNGFISEDELRQICKEHDIKDDDMREIIEQVDKDNDGKINFEEFADMMQIVFSQRRMGTNENFLVRHIPKVIRDPKKGKVVKEVKIRTRNYEYDALRGSNAFGTAAANAPPRDE